MNKLILAAALLLGAWTGAKAQGLAYGESGAIAGIDGIVVSGETYSVRFYDSSVQELVNTGALPGNQVLLIGANDEGYRPTINDLQQALSGIVAQYGSEWIPGCLATCLISSPVGYHAGTQIVWMASIIHNSLRTDVVDTGKELTTSTVGFDHTIAVWLPND